MDQNSLHPPNAKEGVESTETKKTAKPEKDKKAKKGEKKKHEQLYSEEERA